MSFQHRDEGVCLPVYLYHKQGNPLEVVTDLTVDTFLLAFRRFASCRSLPQIFVSDNASTDLAAADEIKQLQLSEHLTEALGR